MAAMKKSELRLLVVFCILILGAITFFALEVVNGRKNDAIASQKGFARQIREFNELIKDRDKWQVRRDFVDRYQQPYRTEEQEAPALESYFRRNADAMGLEIKKLIPNPAEELGNRMMTVSLQAQVVGPGSDVLQFLTLLQAENRFYAIPSITVSSDRKDPTLAVADLIFSRLFVIQWEDDFDEPSEEPVAAPPVEEVAAATEPDPADEPAVSTAPPPGLIEDPTAPAVETN